MDEIDNSTKWTPEDQVELERLEKEIGVNQPDIQDKKEAASKGIRGPFTNLEGILENLRKMVTEKSQDEEVCKPFPIIEHPESFHVGAVYFDWNAEENCFSSFLRRGGREENGVPREALSMAMGFEISKLRKDMDLIRSILGELKTNFQGMLEDFKSLIQERAT